MTVGCSPFFGRSQKEIEWNVTNINVDIRIDEVSGACADLIKALLAKKWSLRMTAESAKASPW
jgi:hypothetical protein